MEWGPGTADAVVTCASPRPVAHPTPLTPHRKKDGVAYLIFICPAGTHQWMKNMECVTLYENIHCNFKAHMNCDIDIVTETETL